MTPKKPLPKRPGSPKGLPPRPLMSPRKAPVRPLYRPSRDVRVGKIPWRKIPWPKGLPAPQIDFGTFPTIQRSGSLPVVWVWHSPDKPEVEAWALYRPGLDDGYEFMSPTAGPTDLYLHWNGVQAFYPPTPPQPDQPYLVPPWGDPENPDHWYEFLLFIVNNWAHVGAISELDLLLMDWRAGAAAGPGEMGLLEPGLFRVREGGSSGAAVAWVLHVPGESREIWNLWDPPNQYVPPGSAKHNATLWFEGVGEPTPRPGGDPAVWLEEWVRDNEAHVGQNGVLVTHDVRIRKVSP